MYRSNHVFEKVFLVIITFACFFTITQKAVFAQSEKEIKELVKQNLEEIWNKGNLTLIEKHYSPEFVRHHVDSGDETVGIEAVKKHVTYMRTAYPDLQYTTDELIVKGDRCIVRWTLTGTNTGPRGKIPATGKKIKVSGVTISKFINGKYAEQWHYFNREIVLIQLGYTITPPSTENGK